MSTRRQILSRDPPLPGDLVMAVPATSGDTHLTPGALRGAYLHRRLWSPDRIALWKVLRVGAGQGAVRVLL